MTAPIAQLRELTVDIATRPGRGAPVVRALTGTDLTLHSGRVTALIGESGCGKSLAAAAFCGLLPPGSQVSGEIRYAGADLARADERTWRRLRGHHLGLVPQSPATSFTPVRTLGAQLTEVCRRLGSEFTVRELLEMAHLDPGSTALYPHELSGGMAQRAAIAAALAGGPEVLIADEPTSALDPANAALVWQLLTGLAATGVSVLVITHDLTSLLAANGCHDIAVMRSGTVLLQQDTAAMTASTDEYLSRFFAGVPV